MDGDKKIIKINNNLIDKPQTIKTMNEKEENTTKQADNYPAQIINKPPIKKRKRGRTVLFAVVSAMAVGLFFGVILLNMLTSFNDSSTEVNQAAPVFTNDDNEDAPSTGPGEYTFESMSAYVIQSGVFNKKENAEQHAAILERSGLKSFLWERGSQFFLLTGLADNEAQAKKIIESTNAGDNELYVKAWNVEELTIQFSEKEYNWLQSFQQNWHESLQQVANGQTLAKTDWEKLNEESPSSKVVEPLISHINEMIKHESSFTDNTQSQYQLLILWQQYEQLQNE